jgi:hypothetical protein
MQRAREDGQAQLHGGLLLRDVVVQEAEHTFVTQVEVGCEAQQENRPLEVVQLGTLSHLFPAFRLDRALAFLMPRAPIEQRIDQLVVTARGKGNKGRRKDFGHVLRSHVQAAVRVFQISLEAGKIREDRRVNPMD